VDIGPPGEYDRTVRVRWRCDIFVKLLYDHLLLLLLLLRRTYMND